MSKSWCQLAFGRQAGISREFVRSVPERCELSSDKNWPHQLKTLRPTLSEAGSE